MEVALRELYQELQACQRRLGTPSETPGDFAQVLRLAHDINNRLTTELLQIGLTESTEVAVASVCRRLLRGH